MSRTFYVGLAASCAAAAMIITAAPARADVITLSSVRDNTLYQDAAGSLSNGAGEGFFAGNTTAGLTRRGLVRFDLSSLPAGATITNVTLTLHMSMTSTGATNVSLHRVLADWGEGTSDAAGGEGAGAPATTGDATWLHTFYNTSFWASAGGDFNAASSALTSVNAVGFYSWSSAQMIADAQQWVATPASNFGWLLRGDESAPNTSKRFDTRESLTASFRPALIIEYTPVPGPGALALLGLAGVIGGHGRRRER